MKFVFSLIKCYIIQVSSCDVFYMMRKKVLDCTQMNKTIDIWLLSQITSKVTNQIKLYHSMILNNHLLQNQCNQILTEMSIAISLFYLLYEIGIM